jgi:hypothetical protein
MMYLLAALRQLAQAMGEYSTSVLNKSDMESFINP